MFEAFEEEYLINSMKENNVVLFLGAGASFGSETSTGEKIPLGNELSKYLRDLIGNTDDSLRLDQVGKDVRRIYGDEGLKAKLEAKFQETRPSQELVDLFSFRWNRCYTLNYDDTIEGIPRKNKKQRHKYYVGVEKVEEVRSGEELQVIHLNGSILKFDKGIVLTDKEFRSGIRRRNPWYEKCAADYSSKTFLFIGTRLDEPIFKSYVEEIEGVTSFAKSFLIAPGELSERDQQDLRELNITPKSATLREFVNWLAGRRSRLEGEKISPTNLAVEIGSPSWIASSIAETELISARNKRNFYSGMYPTWQCVASGWPAKLSIISNCGREIDEFVRKIGKGLCVLVGQAGSGKTTSLMSALHAISESSDRRIFEFKGNGVDDLEALLISLRPQDWSEKSCIIWLPDFQIYADEIEKVSRLSKSFGCTIVGELRSSDWSGRFFGKHKAADHIIKIGKLRDGDYEILADAIEEFATAPEFRRLPREEQVKQLRKSKNQLLILMLEATKQRPFEEIIENEYSSIRDEAAQAFLCIVAIVTMARSRLSISDYQTITSLFGLRSTLSMCLAQLEGIVEISDRGMLIGRHESYVNHIVSAAASVETIYDACLAIFRSFTLYEVPFVVNAGKVKGNILKFMMRGQFLLQAFRGRRDLVSRMYEELEYDFQNDGHYWLQRGKFYRTVGGQQAHETALRFFERSVEAYNNSYARHSLAQQKLIYCSQFGQSSPYLEALMSEGVAELRTQVVTRSDAEDEYPLVALANSHPKVLLAWGRNYEAKRVCRNYYTQLSEMDKHMDHQDREVQEAMRLCLSIMAS